jgi:hypothetical protein
VESGKPALDFLKESSVMDIYHRLIQNIKINLIMETNVFQY